MLEVLLKYPLDWFAAGSIDLGWSWWVYALALLAATAVLTLAAGYLRLAGGRRLLLPRLLLAAGLLLALAQPVLVVERPEPGQGRVAVLLDDSLSMRLGDASGLSPAQTQAALFTAPGAPLPAALAARFEVSYHAFGEGLRGLAPGEALAHDDARSSPGAALLRLSEQAADGLAAVVIASDGDADDGDRHSLQQALLNLRATGVPVYGLDLGATPDRADVELSGLRLPRHSLIGDRIPARVEIRQRGLAGREAWLILEDDGLILQREPVTLPDDGQVLVLEPRLHLSEAGLRRIGARIEALPDERLLENNSLERSVDVRAEPVRVLHFEGEPRFEVKFIRRALAGDDGLRLASLVRTAENKYYRLGIEDPAQLAAGFPQAAELFAYQVLILGSVAADLLDAEQRRSIHDFVARRGGGLLLLGGSQAFAEGGHHLTEMADLMPVMMESAARGYRQRVQLLAGPGASVDPVLDWIGDSPLEDRLQRLPALTVVNPLRNAKPGAQVLLQARDEGGRPLVVLASQRYGAGRVMSFAVRDSWRWQMHAGLDPDDPHHELLWRQMLRELGREAGGRVQLLPGPSLATPGASLSIRAAFFDPLFRPQTEAAAELVVTTPLGDILRQPMSPAADAAHHRQARLVVERAGRYEYAVEWTTPDGDRLSARSHLDVEAAGREYQVLARGPGLLQQIAAQTGGAVVTPARAADLAGLIPPPEGGRQVLQRLPLWDMPLLFMLLLLAAAAEWFLRRRGGQA